MRGRGADAMELTDDRHQAVGLMIDIKQREKLFKQMAHDNELAKVSMEDALHFFFSAVPEHVRGVFSAGWVSGYTAALSLKRDTAPPPVPTDAEMEQLVKESMSGEAETDPAIYHPQMPDSKHPIVGFG